ncbi:Uncharacterised protein [Streptomyces griseus]|nr:Uncharacterised protein [Streptomyces griseus]
MTSSVHSCPGARPSRIRSASWWSSSAWSAVCSRSWVRPAGTGTVSVWLKASIRPPWLCCQCMTGVSGTGPTPSSAAAGAGRGAAPARAASRETVRCSKISRRVSAMFSLRARWASWIELIESPPRSKKLSWTETDSTPSTSATSRHSSASRSFAGSPSAAAGRSVPAGRAARSAGPDGGSTSRARSAASNSSSSPTRSSGRSANSASTASSRSSTSRPAPSVNRSGRWSRRTVIRSPRTVPSRLRA